MGKLLVDVNETLEEHHVDVVEAFWILGTGTLSLRDPNFMHIGFLLEGE